MAPVKNKERATKAKTAIVNKPHNRPPQSSNPPWMVKNNKITPQAIITNVKKFTSVGKAIKKSNA